MATLDRWDAFLDTPRTLTLAQATLDGRDHAPAVVEGTAQISMPAADRFGFTLDGLPTDLPYAMHALRRIRDNPYESLARLRLTGTDPDGVEWAGGYTVPAVSVTAGNWRFAGRLDGITTEDASATVARRSSTELRFLVPLDEPAALAFGRFVGEKPQRRHTLDFFGTSIDFTYDAQRGVLAVAAEHSPELPPTYTERWLSEPFRIMFGQLMFPRLAARNFGDGRAVVFVLRSPAPIPNARWAALLDRAGVHGSKETFWSTYHGLLRLIADARNFEAHRLTRFYEEIIQASRGSRWVWALTFASTIEALAQMLLPDPKPTKAEENDIAALVAHIETGPGASGPRRAAVAAARNTTRNSATRRLRRLAADGVIDDTQIKAWSDMRNAVMHGSLISPYSSEREDAQLTSLSRTMHALTRAILDKLAAA